MCYLACFGHIFPAFNLCNFLLLTYLTSPNYVEGMISGIRCSFGMLKNAERPFEEHPVTKFPNMFHFEGVVRSYHLQLLNRLCATGFDNKACMQLVIFSCL